MSNKPSRKNRRIVGGLVAVLSLFILGGIFILVMVKGVLVAPRSLSFQHSEPAPSDAYQLSPEQQALVDQIGYPDAFTILFYQDAQTDGSPQDVRLEVWTYYQTGQEVTLVNGQIIEQTAVESLPAASSPLPYRPEQFNADMDNQAVLRAAGLREYISAPLETDGLPGGKLFFGQQIAFGFQDDRLAYVESFPGESEAQP